MCLSKIIPVFIFVVFISSGVAKSNNCISDDRSLFLSSHSINVKSARQACKKSGGALAQISNENFGPATNLVFQCLGPNEDAWINSWNSNTNDDECLTLYVGNTSPGGSVAKKCSGKRYALCHIDIDHTKVNTESASEPLLEKEERLSDFPPESSLNLESTAYDDQSDLLASTEVHYSDEEVPNLTNIWHPGDDTGIMKFDNNNNNLEYLWGVGGDIMFDTPNNGNNNNDDTPSKTISVDKDDDEKEEAQMEIKEEGMVVEDEELNSQLADQEQSTSPDITKSQQEKSRNSVKPLVFTDVNKVISDDNNVVQNAKLYPPLW